MNVDTLPFEKDHISDRYGYVDDAFVDAAIQLLEPDDYGAALWGRLKLEALQKKYDLLMARADPKKTPAVALQSYESFDGSKEARKKIKEDFLSGKSTYLCLDYPNLKENCEGLDQNRTVAGYIDDLDSLISDLEELQSKLQAIDTTEDFSDKLDNITVVIETLTFRLYEVYYLKLCKDINDKEAFDKLSPEKQQELVDLCSNLGSSLYGETSKEDKDCVLGEIFSQISRKIETEPPLSPKMQTILGELTSGFSFNPTEYDMQPIDIPGFDMDEFVGKHLPPKFIDPDREVTFEVKEEQRALIRRFKSELIIEKYPKEYKLIKDYYKNNIATKPEGKQVFTPEDILNVFTKLNKLNFDQIEIKDNPKSEMAAWSTSKRAIIVGLLRQPLSSIDDVLGLWAHEDTIHGESSIEGGEINPAFESGVYSFETYGPSSDFLTYEEGLGSVIQGIIAQGEDFAEWTIDDLERTLPIILAQHYSLDSRQVFEVVWRIRVLMTCEPGQDMSDEDIESCRSKSLTNVIRVFRGTPDFRGLTDSKGRKLVFTKDLAYLMGKLRVIRDILEAIKNGVSICEFVDNYVETGRIDINTASDNAKELLDRKRKIKQFDLCIQQLGVQ